MNLIKSSSRENACRLFSMAEIKEATCSFDEQLVIGKGGFGNVYKGLVDDGGSTSVVVVAVKRFNSKSQQGPREFWTEIEMLSRFRHSHLVSLIGYCNDLDEMILVYEYMPNGTLADHLYKVGHPPLSWKQRLKICIGAARGLDYLHTGTGVLDSVIHRDVKTTNILLDESWAAKISDFGLSKVGPANQASTHVSTMIKGTFGYLDPEYFLTQRLTRKSDVYAFGVVLFEVLCGRRALDFTVDEDQHALAIYAQNCVVEGKLDEIIDSSIRGQIAAECLQIFSSIAERCLHCNRIRRPSMAEVVVQLEFALASQVRFETSTLADGDIDRLGDSDSSTDDEEFMEEGRTFRKKKLSPMHPVFPKEVDTRPSSRLVRAVGRVGEAFGHLGEAVERLGEAFGHLGEAVANCAPKRTIKLERR